jgi:lysophospholipase L1-like esterase
VSVTLFLIGCSALALVVAAELGARWWIRSRQTYYVFAPGTRLRLSPDRQAFPELERLVRFEVNRDGERGWAVPRVGANGTLYRVLVAGGSQPEGYLLDQDTHWPGALQRLLATPQHLQQLGASKVHVGNIGLSGVGSEALDLILQRVLPRYPRLQTIVILVGASDMLQWLEQGAPAAPPIPPRTADLFANHPESTFGWSPRRLALVELLRRRYRLWFRPVRVSEPAARWVSRAREMRARAKVIRTAVPDPTPMFDHFETHLRRTIQTAKAHADRVMVVRQSWFQKESYTAEELAHMWHGGAGQAWRDEVSTFYSIDVTCSLMASLDARANRIARELGVDQVDLMAVLEPSLDTYYDFFHLTPSGAMDVASAVAHRLLDDRVETSSFEEEQLRRCVGFRAS